MGVNEYIIKPIDPKVLIEKVQKLIESKQGAAEPIQTKPLNAFLQSPLEIAEFDGSGFKGRSTTAFPIGSEVQFRSPELNEAGIKVRTVKIINCKALPDSDDSYYIQAEFVGLDDEALYDIEEFIQYRKAS